MKTKAEEVASLKAKAESLRVEIDRRNGMPPNNWRRKVEAQEGRIKQRSSENELHQALRMSSENEQ